ncbi:cyclase family protein [Paenibacillus mucilaginosus]|uniref:Kynurenine formamidase n=2 Tax=Paenibacillus mucilaginosus TaxID=61624 RepID=H6NBV6_9BACL|nr:cyclase family protein [Paenibacillus mucilaginosus]AEI42096.1 cyclase family protein [Paenibacillus mucilaginosus KNP414]AFC27907.1 cyclase family protein [Paenibacillus mucilaginosus 3016]MCG7214081.1 cyclase family protein [Paenibacillus mucilaginosus]WDM28604.1 cyclase family protein [Paenibacillus mucilaginosus]WFA16770.1 cyclase family protein [Paenibacillus mucilaginosus]
MFKLYDISSVIRPQMQVWKDLEHNRPVFETVRSHDSGETHETRISLDAHTGTHLDAPLHMLPGGEKIEAIPLGDLIGPARVLDLTGAEDGITRQDLEPFAIQPGEWILLKTKNSYTDEWRDDFIYVKQDGAEYLAGLGIKGVGVDGLGIERSQEGYPTHRTLMRSGVLILEGLRLKEVSGGSYFFVLAPLKLEGIEAAPARAFLMGS